MSFTDNNIHKFLPLSPYVFQILVSLAGGERHGYGIILDVRARTGGALRLGTGTLYTAIKRLLEQELIEERPTPHPGGASDPERRRYYGLTPRGAAVTRAEAERLDVLLQLARERQVLGGNP